MNWIFQKFKNNATKTAIIDNDRKYTYAKLQNQIELFSNILTKNIPAQKNVAYFSDFNFYTIALFLALAKNKKKLVPILKDLPQDEINYRLQTGDAEVFIDVNKNAELKISFLNEKKSKLNVKESVAGFVIFSSGTSGKPKAMLHNLETIINTFKESKTYTSNFLAFLLSDHIGGLNTILTALASTSSITIPHSRKPSEIAQLIENHKVSILPTTPTFLNLLLISHVYKEYNFSSLKIISYGTESMPDTVLKRLKNVFAHIKFIQLFGTSETGIIKTKNALHDSSLLKIDKDKTDYKIIDGTLFLKSKTQVSGYLNQNSDKFTKDGWFNTGDLIEETENGFFRITTRKDNIINVGGEKVFPSEVENILLDLSFVLDCIVYGKTNPITGQSVVADMLIQKNYDKKLAKKEIRKHCFKKMATFKIPTKINFVDSIEINMRFKKSRI